MKVSTSYSCILALVCLLLLWNGVNAQCQARTTEKRESYWCWSGIFHWRCYRTVTKTVYDCYFFQDKSSCVAIKFSIFSYIPGFLEYHTGCFSDPNDYEHKSVTWTDGCLGWFDKCNGPVTKTYDKLPSISKGCPSAIYDCGSAIPGWPNRKLLRGNNDTTTPLKDMVSVKIFN